MGVIDRAVTIQGDLRSAADLIIEGRVFGKVITSAQLVIEAAAVVEGDVEAAAVTVRGRVIGNIVATERVQLGAGSIVHGDITAPSVGLEDGAGLMGRLRMQVDFPDSAREGSSW